MQFTTILSILAVAASAVTAVPTISEEYQVAARARFSELQSRGITVKRDGSLDVRACIHEADEATGMDACDVCYAQNSKLKEMDKLFFF